MISEETYKLRDDLTIVCAWCSVCEAGVVRVTLSLEAGGYGALLLADSLGPELDTFLATMAEMTARPLGAYSSEWAPLQQERHINPFAALIIG